MTAPRTDGGPVRRLLRYLTAPERALRWSAVLTLIALGLMVWSIAAPTPLPVLVAMTVGQGLGTVAFAMYGYVVIQDLRRIRRDRRASSRSIPQPASEHESSS